MEIQLRFVGSDSINEHAFCSGSAGEMDMLAHIDPFFIIIGIIITHWSALLANVLNKSTIPGRLTTFD